MTQFAVHIWVQLHRLQCNIVTFLGIINIYIPERITRAGYNTVILWGELLKAEWHKLQLCGNKALRKMLAPKKAEKNEKKSGYYKVRNIWSAGSTSQIILLGTYEGLRTQAACPDIQLLVWSGDLEALDCWVHPPLPHANCLRRKECIHIFGVENLKKGNLEDVVRMDLAQDRVQWQASVLTAVLNFRVLQ
jgi:hypothetical protein